MKLLRVLLCLCVCQACTSFEVKHPPGQLVQFEKDSPLISAMVVKGLGILRWDNINEKLSLTYVKWEAGKSRYEINQIPLQLTHLDDQCFVLLPGTEETPPNYALVKIKSFGEKGQWMFELFVPSEEGLEQLYAENKIPEASISSNTFSSNASKKDIEQFLQLYGSRAFESANDDKPSPMYILKFVSASPPNLELLRSFLTQCFVNKPS